MPLPHMVQSYSPGGANVHYFARWRQCASHTSASHTQKAKNGYHGNAPYNNDHFAALCLGLPG